MLPEAVRCARTKDELRAIPAGQPVCLSTLLNEYSSLTVPYYVGCV